jgi:preprotein translocase subunit SecY
LFGTIRNALRISDLRRRILFTLYMILVLRIGAHIPVPGVDLAVIARLFQEGTLWGWLDMFSGGAFKSFTVMAMNISPYITSSIIVQLLTIVIPSWEKMVKEGEEGRKKMTQWTRYGTIVLGLIQAYGMAFGLREAVITPTVPSFLLIALTLTAGTAFLMWLGEQITERGIGNGISIIIFAGIVSRLPAGAGNLVEYLKAGRINILNVLVLAVLGLAVIALIIWVNEGQRRISVQYAKRVVGKKVYGGQSTHIPMRVNHAGVIPVIFASSVLLFPATIAQFIRHPIAQKIAAALTPQGNWYYVLYTLFIVFFTYFYTAVSFNPVEVSNNIKKYGGFIPGLRPGRPTAEYLAKVLERITLPGAIFLALIAGILPLGARLVTDIPGVYLGGTALLIVVGVALETMKQLEAHLLMRHYQGFMK